MGGTDSLIFTIFSLGSLTYAKIFYGMQEDFTPSWGNYSLIASSSRRKTLSIAEGPVKYDFQFVGNYGFGIVRDPQNPKPEFDFEGLLWGFYKNDKGVIDHD